MLEHTQFMDKITSIEEKLEELQQSLNSLAYRCGSAGGENFKLFEHIRDAISSVDSVYNEECEKIEKRIERLESSGNYNKDYGLTLHAQIIGLLEKIAILSPLVLAHEDYMRKIDKIALHDPEKTIENMKFLNERLEQIEKVCQINFDEKSGFYAQLEELRKEINEISRYECHNRALIEDLNLSLTEYVNAVADISMRVNKVDSLLREFEKQKIQPKFEEVATAISNHDERIHDLENIGAESRLLGLEEELKSVSNALYVRNKEFFDLRDECRKILSETNYQPKPYKCPVCNGLTLLSRKYVDESVGENTNLPPAICISCEGKGIIWG